MVENSVVLTITRIKVKFVIQSLKHVAAEKHGNVPVREYIFLKM